MLAGAIRRFREEGAAREGAAIAFYTTLSLAPLLLVMATVAAFFVGGETARGYLLDQTGSIVGKQGGAFLGQMLAGGATTQAKGWAAIIGVASTLAGATAGFVELQIALNRIFRASAARSGLFAMLRVRLSSLLLVIAVGLLMVVSLALTALVSRSASWLKGYGELIAVGALVGNELITLGLATVLFGLLLMVLPDRRVPWKFALRGGFLAAVLFQATKIVIGWYIGRTAGTAAYGAAAALVVLMLWIYFSAQVFLLGGEYAAALMDYRRNRGEGISADPQENLGLPLR